ncbi:MAG: hypothetical protein ACRBG0_24945 [Lewinella sp.]|jgi:hypothetical protein|uniref:hypothetical protein n=1 Tax=Lewinella sp. TaxID=2004506 RepID=UPI003D6A0FD3
MYRNHCAVFVFLSLALTFSGCKLENLNDPIIVPLVDKEFSLDLGQVLGVTTLSNLELEMYTIEEEDCLNTKILSNYNRTGRNISLTLYDILDPEVCDPGPAPATGSQLVTDASPDVYTLTIELQDVVSNAGTLTVTEDMYKVVMEEENGISWLHTELRKIPEDVLWGYLVYNNTEEENQISTLVSEINDLGSEPNLTNGYYGYFSVINSGDITELKDAPITNNLMTILVKYTGETTEIDQKISEFLATPGNEAIELVLLDSEGNEWRN